MTNRPRAGVKSAELEYSLIDSVESDSSTLSLVRVRLKTGRFHQIRAQFASRKMPLIGDKKYGSRDFKRNTPSLFATRLAFEFGGKAIDVSVAPDTAEYPWSMFEDERYRL